MSVEDKTLLNGSIRAQKVAGKNAASDLETVHALARRLGQEAMWDGSACTWPVVPGREDGEWMGPTLYEGTAGVGWVLAEAAAATGDAQVRRTALGALRHAHATLPGVPEDPFGVYTGPLGVAAAAARAGHILNAPEALRLAGALVDALPEAPPRGCDLGVIGGLAGAVPVLLRLADTLQRPEMVDRAVVLGDVLLQAAHVGPVGWWWDTLTYPAVRPLCGLGHGASGVAWALAELAAATDEGAFAYAARQALVYEDAHADAEKSNWPDFRYFGLGAALRTDPADAGDLRATVPPYRSRCLAYWCHGAPGIALARLRILRLLGVDAGRVPVQIALEATAASLDDPALGTSLCHGTTGNAEALVLAGDLPEGLLKTTPDPDWSRRVNAVAQDLVDRFAAGESWASGCPGGRPNRSLMLGDAGVGLFLLRRVDPTVPSAVLLTPGAACDRSPARRVPRTGRTEAAARERTVNALFGRTRRTVHRLTGTDALVPKTGDAAAHARSVLSRLMQGDDRRARWVRDAAAPEWAADARARETTVEEAAAALRHRAWQRRRPNPSKTTRVCLAPHIELILQQFDWDAWLASPPSDPLGTAPGGTFDAPPPSHPRTWMVVRAGHAIEARLLDALPAAILTRCAATPVSIHALVDALSQTPLPTGECPPSSHILAVLRALWAKGYVDPV